MRRLCLLFVCTATALLVAAAPAFAQRVPSGRSLAAGADLGLFLGGNDVDTSITLDGFGEVFVTPRVSIRGLVGWTSPGISGADDTHLRQNRLLFNAVYNWERNEWHPFVTGGAGLYFVTRTREGRPDDEGDTRGGINLGGGVEYFTNDMLSWKGEAAWHWIGHPDGTINPSGLAVTGGVKLYF